MPKGTNQKFKLYHLMKIFLAKTDSEHALTLAQLKAELEMYDVTAERKSLYMDIADLEKLGVKVAGKTDGKKYVYNVVEREFELAELKLLVDAIQSSKFITEKKSRKLIKKLEKYCSEYEAKQLHRQVFVQGRIKTNNEGIYKSVDAIHAAITDNVQIRFKYSRWNTDAELELKRNGGFYQISPWALTWDDENYYLVAYDDESSKIKHYRVDKMTDVRVTDKTRNGKEEFKGFDLALYAKRNFGMYGGLMERVSVEIENDKVGIFIDRFGKDVSIWKCDENHVRVTFDVAVSGQFFGWIFGLGSGVKITAPQNVVDEAKSYIDGLSNMYR